MFDLKKYREVIFHDIKEWCKIWRKTDLLLGKWHEEFCKFSPEHSKVSKLELWWDPFVQSRKCMSFKFTVELCVMTMKNDIKIEEALTCRFKSWHDNLSHKIWPEHSKSLKIFFNWLLLTKVYIAWATKVQTSYLSWHRSYANFEERLTSGLKKDMKNLANFQQNTWKCQNWDFDGILLSKVGMVWP